MNLRTRLSSCFRRASQIATVARAIAVSGFLGGDLATLLLLNRPRAALRYVQYSLFGWRMIRRQGLPQCQFHEAFETPEQVSIDLLPTSLSTTITDDENVAAHACYVRSSEYLYLTHPAGEKVRQLYGDSGAFDFTPYRERIDLFFVDGASSYEYVRSDFLSAPSCACQGGGLFCMTAADGGETASRDGSINLPVLARTSAGCQAPVWLF